MFKLSDVSKISSGESFKVYKNILISGDERLEYFIDSFLHENILAAVLEGDYISILWKEYIPLEYEVGRRIEFSYSEVIDNSVCLCYDEFRVKNSIMAC